MKAINRLMRSYNWIRIRSAVMVKLKLDWMRSALKSTFRATDTVNRWLLDHAERIPDSGENFVLDDFEVLVKSASKRRIHEVVITRLEPSTVNSDIPLN